ncbi:Stress response protein nst1, partial [Neolecta irregularis DAH-3]
MPAQPAQDIAKGAAPQSPHPYSRLQCTHNHNHAHAKPTDTAAPPSSKKKKKKRRKAKEAPPPDPITHNEYHRGISQQFGEFGNPGEYDSEEEDEDAYQPLSYLPPSELPPPLPQMKSKGKTIVTEIHASVSIQIPRKNKDRIWNTSTGEERERIKEFWLQLGEGERRGLVKVEKDAVLKKMKEQQKHTCSCTVCGRKRNAIEEELEVLYNAYYEELEQYANHQRQYGVHALAGPFPGSTPLQEETDEEYGEEEDYDEDEYSGDEEEPRPDFFTFGNSLTVKGGILTVADDLLKNDGKKFIDMMEQLAERRMQREEEAAIEAQAEYEDEEEYGEDEDEYEDEDEDEDEEEAVSEEQRMAEGRRMFQVFAARMFEQRVLHAYREKVAQDRQRRLLEELEEESRKAETRELRKAREKEKKKDKRRLEKQRKDEERQRREAEALKLEEQRREAEALRLEEQRKRREEQRARREAERRAA